MSSYPRYYRPALKNSVDVQLQTAFNDGQWSTVTRLAAQRYKMKKDPYYETIRICAESQLDSVADKSTLVSAVDALVRDKTAVLDIDSIELYEWALQELDIPTNFSQTIGVLRVRWAKANPSSPAVIDCLEACVLEWDLANAQQIAVTLDKAQSSKYDGKSMFWNITLTHLLSTSPQCPENMSAMFSKLARMQLDKAAQATTTTTNGKPTARGLREEEEINLYYRVVGKDAYLKSVVENSSSISVYKQFEQGRKYLLIESLRAFEEAGDWDNVYKLCKFALSQDDEHGKPSFLAFDMRIWKTFVKAASMRSDVEGAFADATSVLDRYVSTTSSVPPMYKKNIGLVTLELAFQGPPSFSTGIASPLKPSPRIITLYLVLEQSVFQRAAFDDVKEYVCQLSLGEAKYFLDNFSRVLLGKDPNEQRKIVVRVLEIKFRYLLTTCPLTLEHIVVVGEAGEPRLKCNFCSSITPKNCNTCLESVASAALSAYKDVDKSPESLKGLDKDPRSDLALVATSALLKLSGLRQTQLSTKLPPLSAVDMSRLLQATIILGTQASRAPEEIPLRLLLVQVYLLLGCASLAHQTWLPLDVKRTIQDALSPLFFDRLSSISPGLFHEGRRPLTEPLSSYYQACLREDSPVKVWEAFTAGSYTSILDMAEYWDRLRRSCTLVMTVTEERRALRSFGGKIESSVEQLPLLAHVDDDTTFVNAIDHGSFPSLESTNTAPLYDLVKLGPKLSSERCRLALLAEQFIDIVTYKPAKEYKPPKANDVAMKDKAYFIESFSRLHEAISTALLNLPTTAAKLTSAENKFYTTIALLSALLCTALQTSKSEPTASSLSTTISGIKSTIASIEEDCSSVSPMMSGLDMADVLHSLTNPHTLSYLRETALATKQTATFLTNFHAAEQARDRSGKSNLHKDIVAETKGLDELATKTLAEGKARVKELKDALGQGGWLDRMEGWVFPDEDALGDLVRDVVGAAEVEEWAGKVAESWREGIKGFGMVVWQ